MALDYAVRLACTRLVQTVGNFMKAIFYLDVWIRPNKRYRIPSVAQPLIRASKGRAIPRIVWLTNYSDRVTLSIYTNYLFNRCIAPTHEFRFYGDSDCLNFMESRPESVSAAYRKLQIGAARADFWRVEILREHGGIYLDIDAAFSRPPEFFLHADQTELFAREKDGRLTNYFLAATPRHPLLADITQKIVSNISANSLTSVYDMTGPTVVDEIARNASVRIEPSRLFCRQGQFTSKSLQYPDDLKGYWAREEEKGPIVLETSSPDGRRVEQAR